MHEKEKCLWPWHTILVAGWNNYLLHSEKKHVLGAKHLCLTTDMIQKKKFKIIWVCAQKSLIPGTSFRDFFEWIGGVFADKRCIGYLKINKGGVVWLW